VSACYLKCARCAYYRGDAVELPLNSSVVTGNPSMRCRCGVETKEEMQTWDFMPMSAVITLHGRIQ
jgi:hypothetical protein